MKAYAVGKAQKIILEALNLSAETYKEAVDVFAKYGLSVSSKREGRKSVPVVRKLDTYESGFHDGDGYCEEIPYEKIDLLPIFQFMKM